MKKIYVAPRLENIIFESNDIVTASGSVQETGLNYSAIFGGGFEG